MIYYNSKYNIKMSYVDNIPKDIINEIFYYLPYTLLRSLNKYYNILANNYEIRNPTPIKRNQKLFIKYLKSKPDVITLSRGGSLYEYNYRGIYNNGNIIVDDVYSCYNIKNIDDYQHNRECWSTLSINDVIDNFLYEDRINQNDIQILYPSFLNFLLNHHPLRNNTDFIRKKLIITFEYLLNINQFENARRHLYIACLDMRVPMTFINVNHSGALYIDFEKTKENFFNTLSNFELYYIKNNNVINEDSTYDTIFKSKYIYSFIFLGVISITLLKLLYRK